MRRDVFETVGLLDQQFGSGLFEDDDYCCRVQEAGFSLVCADDVLVHHFGRGTFGDMIPTGEYMALFEANKQRFEDKWRRQWETPEHADETGYALLRDQLVRLVMDVVPEGESVAVASKGDPILLDLPGRVAEHFPSTGQGSMGGYPADSAEAVREVDRLYGRGVRFLVFPETAAWWLDYYPGLALRLTEGGREAARQADVGVVYALGAKR